MGVYKEEGVTLLSLVFSKRKTDSEHKRKYRKFHLNMEKKVTARMVKSWNRLPRDVIQTPQRFFWKMPAGDWATESRSGT